MLPCSCLCSGTTACRTGAPGTPGTPLAVHRTALPVTGLYLPVGTTAFLATALFRRPAPAYIKMQCPHGFSIIIDSDST